MLLKRAREVEKDASYRKIMVDLKRIKAITFNIHKTKVTARTEIGDNAKIAYKALKIAFPKKVLAHESENLIAISN